MERKNRWNAANAEESRCFRKLEKRYFRKHLTNRIFIGMLIFGLGIGLIITVYLEADKQYWDQNFESALISALSNKETPEEDLKGQESMGPKSTGPVDQSSYSAAMIIWSILFLGGYGYYIYFLFQRHQEFKKNPIYCKRVVCIGKENLRISADVDLMTEEGKILEGLTIPLYVLEDIELHKPVYLVVTDPKAFYEQADIYPSPFEEKNPMNTPEAAEFFFRG